MVSRRARLPLVVLMLALVLPATSSTLMAKGKKASSFSWSGGSGLTDEPNCYWWCYYSPKEGSAVVDSAEECGALCAVSCGGQCDQI